jgi:membrane fusion protein (multidrug efflux system)
MQSRRVVITLLQLSVLLALLVVLYRLSIHDQWIPTAITGDNDEDDMKYRPIVPVSIGTVVKTTMRSYVAGYGVVEPQPARPGISAGGASVNAPTPALVASVQVVEGQPVKRGQPLFSLDDRAVVAQIARAKQDADSAARIARESDQAFESKAVTRSQVLRAHAASDAAQAALVAAEAQRATLVLAAPIDGIVTQIRVRAGEVTPISLAAVELVDPDRLVVAVQVPQWQLHELKVGQPAVFTATQTPASQPASQPDLQSAPDASVAYIDPDIDPRTGLGQVDVTVPPGFGYRIGQFVSLRIVTAQHDNCLAVPAASIVQDANGVQTVSLVEHEYHQAFRQIVTVGIRENGLAEILNSDLKAGQPIVTTGAYALIDGSQIEVIP